MKLKMLVCDGLVQRVYIKRRHAGLLENGDTREESRCPEKNAAEARESSLFSLVEVSLFRLSLVNSCGLLGLAGDGLRHVSFSDTAGRDA
jgi:hypothetical protein